ncbi:hypothetical protein BDZ97DRAFT_1922262 [Flammula alnicola]|nr:hypothetical protein BDZ97DRAFT_1922262 [Flammula alnicola]
MASQDDALLFKELVGTRTVMYAEAAAVSMFLWDYLLTLEMEMSLVWKSKCNLVNFLFFVQRYTPFIDTACLAVYSRWGHNMSPDECSRLGYISGFMYLVGMGSAELILTLRVWALWDRNRLMFIIFSFGYVVLCFPSFASMYYFHKYLVFSEAPYPGFRGCFTVGERPYIVFHWTILLMWNTSTLILMIIPSIHAYRLGVRTRLTTIIYRDGIFYYMFLFFLSIVNIVVTLVLPPSMRAIMTAYVLSFAKCIFSSTHSYSGSTV